MCKFGFYFRDKSSAKAFCGAVLPGSAGDRGVLREISAFVTPYGAESTRHDHARLDFTPPGEAKTGAACSAFVTPLLMILTPPAATPESNTEEGIGEKTIRSLKETGMYEEEEEEAFDAPKRQR